MKVALFFGSFNPIHTGHTQLAEYLVAKDLFEEIWFVVSPCNPLKNQADLLDEYVRLDMLVAAKARYGKAGLFKPLHLVLQFDIYLITAYLPTEKIQ